MHSCRRSVGGVASQPRCLERRQLTCSLSESAQRLYATRTTTTTTTTSDNVERLGESLKEQQSPYQDSDLTLASAPTPAGMTSAQSHPTHVALGHRMPLLRHPQPMHRYVSPHRTSSPKVYTPTIFPCCTT